jgi:AraC-like DNA-binding protein
MYVECVPNRSSPPAILLRESFRQNGKVKKRTVANISAWSPEKIGAMRAVLRGETIPGDVERLWEVDSPKAGSYRHRVTPGFGHALLSPLVASVFRFLRVSASVTKGGFWWALHNAPDPIPFEVEHDAALARYRYNDRHLGLVHKHARAILGKHAGYSDWFVPIRVGSKVMAVLVAGPFLVARPTSASILEHWRVMTGREGNPTDPAFAAYLAVALSTLVLEGERADRFGLFLGCLARLMAAEEPADALTNEADALRVELQKARAVEAAWDAVASMLDDRSPRIWSSAHRSYALGELGLSRIADHILVALTTSPSGGDAVEAALRRDAFQRDAVDLARSVGNTLAGRVGDHGVVFLSAASGGAAKGRARALELSSRAELVARRDCGLSLSFGASAALGSVPLSRSYQAALAAAESALVSGERLVVAQTIERRSGHSLRHLRRELERAVDQRPDSLPARFDRYLETVVVECGYRREAVHAHLESGFERMAEPLVETGNLDERSFRALCDGLDRSAASAPTVSELCAAYRRAAADLSAAASRPALARRDRSLRRAIEYVREHYTEPVHLESVAQVAGFSPKYFCKVFKARERKSLGAYVSGLRLERARKLLEQTTLSATRIAELCGFRSSQYFSRAFLRSTGRTPLVYRQRGTQRE